MALFKILKGTNANLGASTSDNSKLTHEGWAYFVTDTGEFYIDITSGESPTIGTNRIPVSKYTSGTGISLTGTNVKTISLATSGVTAGTYGPTADVNGTNGTAMTIPQIVVDSYGRIISVTKRKYTSRDYCVSNTLSTTTKFYVTGTSSATSHTGTQYFDTGIYATTTAGQLNATSYKVDEHVNLQYNSIDQSLDFVFV